MIYVFYNNDPLGDDQGGGAEHFRGIYRALKRSGIDFRMIAARVESRQDPDPRVVYISDGTNFGKYFANLFAWFIRNRKKFGEGDVFHFHRNYAIWPKHLIVNGIGKTIITYHGRTGLVLQKRLGLAARPLRSLMKAVERRAVHLADEIIFVSERDRVAMAHDILRANIAKSRVIPAAFDSRGFAYSTPPNPSLATKLVMVGRLSEIKNIPLALDAISLLRAQGVDVSLTIVGEGEHRAAIESHISSLRIQDQVRLLGRVPHKNIPALLAENGMVLLTSWSEASPTIVKEGIAARRPVVTTDVGDVREWLSEGKNGFICEMNAKDVARGIRLAMQMIATQSYASEDTTDSLSEDVIMGRVLQTYSSAA